MGTAVGVCYMSLLKEKLHVYIERKTMFLISSSAIKIVKAVI